MDIDLSVLRSLESEKDISSETAIKAIEDALLMAYHKTEGANPARTGRGGPQDRARHGLGQGAGRDGRRAGSTTTPRRASAGSPRPPPGR